MEVVDLHKKKKPLNITQISFNFCRVRWFIQLNQTLRKGAESLILSQISVSISGAPEFVKHTYIQEGYVHCIFKFKGCYYNSLQLW